jgi:hypothetical protein
MNKRRCGTISIVQRWGAAMMAAGLVLAGAGSALAQITRGAISGTVQDTSGAVVPGATVRIINVETNVGRVAITDAKGFYRVAALEPAQYTVRVEQTGLTTVETKDVTVRTATEVTLNVEMKVAGLGETLTVLARGEGVELNKSNPTVGLTASARQVVELPLSATRDINSLIGLSPNVVLAHNAGGTAAAGQGTYAANGQRTRNNNYTLDGSDNNDISVTISTSQVVPEAVAEFQVLTNPYQVEFGRNSGAQVNVITKSGTNDLHGEVWDYFRTSDLYALTNIQKASNLTEPPKFTRHQAGASLGGPLRKDKTFFFLLYQYDAQRPEGGPFVTATRIPTPEGFAALQNVPLGAGQPTASRQAVLERLGFLNQIYAQNVTFRNVTPTQVNGVSIATGQTNVNIKDPSTYHTVLGRVDHSLTERDNVSIRYHYNKRRDDNAISNCTFGPIFCGSQDLKDTNLAVSETHVFHSGLLNEFRGSWVQRDLLFPENDPKSPTATITGLFTIGGDAGFPQSRITDSFQFANTLTWTRSRHTFKFGADIRYNKAFNESGFDTKGTFTFNNLQDYMNNSAFRFDQALQTASWDARQWQTYFFVQDDFRPTPDLTLNIGLRYELSTVPLGMFGATDPESLAVGVPGPARKDTNNWAPRVGFAWSPRSGGSLLGDGKTVIRGGFGIGYDVVFYNLLTVNGSNYPRVFTANVFDVKNVYPNLQTASGSPVFNPLGAYTNSPEDLQSPDSRFWSLSVGRELGDFVVEAGYTGSRSGHGINQILANPAILTPEQAALVRSGGTIPAAQARRINPQFGVRTLIPAYVGPGGNDVEARSEYHGGYLSVHKRLSHRVQGGVSYTLSRWMSNNDGSLGEGGTANGSNQRPQNMFDYEVEWSRSQFDRPRRFAAHYIIELPGPKSGVLKQVLGGWQLAGKTEFQSGRPFTVVTGVDSNGDTNTGSDRPNLGPGTFDWDGDHREFKNNGLYVTPLGSNNLPLQNAQGDGNAPRNRERGAAYSNTDLSFSKRFFFGRRAVLVRADLLNALNQDNYGNPIVTMSNPGFGTNTNNWGGRTVTLGAKFTW